jgi:hypothetical protein
MECSSGLARRGGARVWTAELVWGVRGWRRAMFKSATRLRLPAPPPRFQLRTPAGVRVCAGGWRCSNHPVHHPRAQRASCSFTQFGSQASKKSPEGARASRPPAPLLVHAVAAPAIAATSRSQSRLQPLHLLQRGRARDGGLQGHHLLLRRRLCSSALRCCCSSCCSSCSGCRRRRRRATTVNRRRYPHSNRRRRRRAPLGKLLARLRALLRLDFGKVEHLERGQQRHDVQAVVGSRRARVAPKRQERERLAKGGERREVAQLGEAVVGEDEGLETREEVAEPWGDAADAVVGQEQLLELGQAGEAVEPGDRVVAQVDRRELVLLFWWCFGVECVVGGRAQWRGGGLEGTRCGKDGVLARSRFPSPSARALRRPLAAPVAVVVPAWRPGSQ